MMMEKTIKKKIKKQNLAYRRRNQREERRIKRAEKIQEPRRQQNE